jgi:hypothetical protein
VLRPAGLYFWLSLVGPSPISYRLIHTNFAYKSEYANPYRPDCTGGEACRRNS